MVTIQKDKLVKVLTSSVCVPTCLWVHVLSLGIGLEILRADLDRLIPQQNMMVQFHLCVSKFLFQK